MGELGLLAEELGLDLTDALAELGLDLEAALDALDAVHDRRVILTVEELGDSLVGAVGMLLHQVHDDLAGQGQLGLARGDLELRGLDRVDAADSVEDARGGELEPLDIDRAADDLARRR